MVSVDNYPNSRLSSNDQSTVFKQLGSSYQNYTSRYSRANSIVLKKCFLLIRSAQLVTARADLVRSAQRYLISYQSTDLNYAVKISSDRQRTMRERRQTDCDEIMHDCYSSLCLQYSSFIYCASKLSR